MKKLMTIGTALALALTLSATGCKKKTEEAKPTTTEKPVENKGSAAPTPTPTPTDPAAAGTQAPPAGSAAPTPTDPAAPPAAAASTGVPECDEYLATLEKAATCDKFAPSLEAARKSADAWKASTAGWAALDEAARKAAQTAAAPGCKQASDGVKATATGAGCVL